MEYNKTIWSERLTEFQNRFSMVANPDGTISLVPFEGNVIQPGTAITVPRLQNIEDGIENVDVVIADNVGRLNEVNALQSMEITKLWLELDLQKLSGVGFYDIFEDTTDVNLPLTNATVNTTAQDVTFITGTYELTASANYTGQTVIRTDEPGSAGDRINDTNEILGVVPIDSSVTYDRTTPVQVVNSAYTTSASARPQVLSNGDMIVAVKNGTTLIELYKSTDNGATWVSFDTVATSGLVDISIAVYGMDIKVIFTRDGFRTVTFRYTGGILPRSALLDIDTSQTAIGNCSLAVNPANGHLTASWSSKNATYPNSFNIRSAKSVDGGVTWTKQDGTAGVDQVTTNNTTGQDKTAPCVVYMSNGYPIIVNAFNNGSAEHYINKNIWNGTSWVISSYVYFISGNYTQTSPTATVDSTGVIHVAWEGKDATDTTSNNIRYSKSSDNGTTWSAMIKLTTGNIRTHRYPSITTDVNNKVFILFTSPSNDTYSFFDIALLTDVSGSWVLTYLTNTPTSIAENYASVCDNYKNFEKPITIWQTGSDVRFYGKWTVGGIVYETTLQSPVTVTEGQKLTVYPDAYPFEQLTMDAQGFGFEVDSVLTQVYSKNNLRQATVQGAVTNLNLITVEELMTTSDKVWKDKLYNINSVTEVSSAVTYDRTTPVQIVNSPFSTSDSARPQRLANGWLVTLAYDSSLSRLNFYASLDNGATWVFMGYKSASSAVGFSLAVNGNQVYCLYTYLTNRSAFFSFNALNYNGANLGSIATPDLTISTDTTVAGCSLAISPTGVLTAVWSSISSTYPNSYNIRSAKSVDGGITWTKQDGTAGVDFVLPANTTGLDCRNPIVSYMSNGNPIIVFDLQYTGNTSTIKSSRWTGSAWTDKDIYQAAIAQAQTAPSLTVDLIGTIHVAWFGSDTTDNSLNNIRYSKSTDHGATWSAMQKLTSGNTYDQSRPSIATNMSNHVYIVFMGKKASTSTAYNIRQLLYTSSWVLTEITDLSVSSSFPSICNVKDFDNPLTVWKNTTDNKFYGKWTIGGSVYDLTLDSPITVADDEKLTLVDFKTEVNGVESTLTKVSGKVITFENQAVGSPDITSKIYGKSSAVMDNLLLAVS